MCLCVPFLRSLLVVALAVLVSLPASLAFLVHPQVGWFGTRPTFVLRHLYHGEDDQGQQGMAIRRSIVLINTRNFHRKQAEKFSTSRLCLSPSSPNHSNTNNFNSKNENTAKHPQQQKEETTVDYKDKLDELNLAIAAAEKERKEILRRELERSTSFKPTNLEDFDDDASKRVDTTSNIHNDEIFNDELLVPVEQWKPRDLRKPPPTLLQRQESQQPQKKPRSYTTRSQISRSDAGTLVIEITPQGITSGVLFNGAFSVAWFSAIVPATLTALSGGLFGVALFMVPFWAAGGMIAKQTVLDPFISHQLSIGEFAWSVESKYGGKGPSIQRQEGSTPDLQGAKVELSVVVNGVPQYQLSLFSRKGVTNLGLGLPLEELERVANEINQYLDNIQSERATVDDRTWSALESDEN